MSRFYRTTGSLLPFLTAACLMAAFFSQGQVVQSLATPDQMLQIERFWSEQYGKVSGVVPEGRFDAVKYVSEVVAKAQPDECFQGIGNPANLSDILGFLPNYPGDLTEAQKDACAAIPVTEYVTLNGHAQPKVNQAYVWGLTRHNHDLWFGTISNTHCLVISGFLQVTEPSLNSSWVCEGSQSPTADVRPPRAFYFSIRDKSLHEVTRDILARSETDSARLRGTIGLRSAGSHRGVIFLAGITTRGVSMFAFDASTKQYLGSISFDGQSGRPLYTNIRQWRVIKGELYVGVAKPGGGEILKWTGASANPFVFENVGEIIGDPAYLTYHQGRVFVSSWPTGTSPMSIWMSPEIGASGQLATFDAAHWQRVWSIADYDPERSVVFSTAGGALMSYKGHLYWGTMHVPGLSLLLWRNLNPTASEEDSRAAVLGTYRPISIFRATALGTSDQKVELLYGNARLPSFTPESGWTISDNRMQQAPKFGLAGFNNFFNNYTWWMEVFDGRLFVGTMDFLYLGAAGIRDRFEFPAIVSRTFERFYGADLWSFSSRNAPATPISRSGLGNFTNYGIRTMVVTRDALYLGTANPMNLLTDQTDDMPEGGWELIKLTREGERKDLREQ